MIRLLVCGGRDYADRETVHAVLDALHEDAPIATLIHGAAPGADSLASQWAFANGIEEAVYPADWATHGRAAGPMRNRRMLTDGRPGLVIAFPGGLGTANMVDQARKAGVTILEMVE